ncbi:Glucosaminyl phosphatidylinositol (GlcN-PI) nositol acylation protein [Spiromyces aspiralis]|uniref:Glucosaminyl phosphatidylinositol (GlcN-PI) nositol acylation protein n=1 Tax=Spiromyces aspiralis TaxID=68401 RepID=A0ACC1HPX3_9FUNG|nr:Glucosaminyl phosphatidylinositol (GlcN-PI) nositol acylation protein [Spiromyces aspiralis]
MLWSYTTWGMTPQEQQAYKVRKEAFVTNTPDSSVFESQCIIIFTVLSYWAWKTLTAKAFHEDHGNPKYIRGGIIKEWLIFVAPVMVAMLGMGWKLRLTLAVGLAAWGIYNVKTGLPDKPIRHDKWAKDPRAVAYDSSMADNGKGNSAVTRISPKGYLTASRAMLMVQTCFAILAVDFNVFPRRLSKSEDYGNSIMDLGVGAFVFTAGLVGAKPLLREGRYSNYSVAGSSAMWLVLRGLKTAAPLLGLGLIRLVTVEKTNYQKHVTEYGVHWNFFLTLGLLPLFVPLCLKYIMPFNQPRVAGYIVASAYQLLLLGGLEDWIMGPDRSNLIAENKEGLCSFLGYLATYLIGMGLGKDLLPDPPTWEARADLPIGVLAEWVLTWQAYMIFEHIFGIKTSRRLANLSYVLWVSWSVTVILWFMLVIENWVDGRLPPRLINTYLPSWYRAPRLLDAVNQNGLVTFMFANLLTGAINLTLRTLDVPDSAAIVILAVYMVAIFVPCTLLYYRGIRLK